MRGEDFFRGAVIEALGDYSATYAVPTIAEVAQLDGPLQDDAMMAIGQDRGRVALDALAGCSERRATSQPTIAAAICLLGVDCEAHVAYLEKTLAFAAANAGYQALCAAPRTGWCACAAAARRTALEALLDAGIPAQRPARAPSRSASARRAAQPAA